MTTELDEHDLIACAKKGDLQAFNVVVERYQRRVYNLCLRMLASQQAAEDATQEAFIHAFRSIESFRGGAFHSWLLRIAANACYDEMRRGRSRSALSLDEPHRAGERPVDVPDPGLTLDEHVERGELGAAIQAALSRIPAEQRLAVILCDVQGMDYAEIAVITGVSVGTVKSRISRGRSLLRDLLRARGELLPSRLRQASEGHNDAMV